MLKQQVSEAEAHVDAIKGHLAAKKEVGTRTLRFVHCALCSVLCKGPCIVTRRDKGASGSRKGGGRENSNTTMRLRGLSY